MIQNNVLHSVGKIICILLFGLIHSDPLLSHPSPALFPPESFPTSAVTWLARRFP